MSLYRMDGMLWSVKCVKISRSILMKIGAIYYLYVTKLYEIIYNVK